MLFNRKQLSVLLIFLYFSSIGQAHHSFAVEFTAEKKVAIRAPLPRSGFVILMSDIMLNLLINKEKKKAGTSGQAVPPY